MISVALTTYNGEKFLRQQLDSIYAQTYKDIEVVACDDGSRDGTVAILREYEKTYGLRVYINEVNLGYIKNFEKACLLCKGEYIALSDQDDIWFPEKLMTLREEIQECLLVFSDLMIINEKGAVVAESMFQHYLINALRALSVKHMAFRNYITGCSLMFRTELLNSAIPFQNGVSHDYWLSLHALEKGKIRLCRKVLTQYRLHGNNQVGIGNVSIKGSLQRMRLLKQEFSQNYTTLQRIKQRTDAFSGRLMKFLCLAEKVYGSLISIYTPGIMKIILLLRYYKYLIGKSLTSLFILRVKSLLCKENRCEDTNYT